MVAPLTKKKKDQILDRLSEPDDPSLNTVVRETDTPYSTVKDTKTKNPEVIEVRRQLKWADIDFKGLASNARDRADDQLKNASAKDAAIVMGIATEKGHLIEGKATQLVGVVHEHRHNVTGVLEAIRQTLEQRQATHQLIDEGEQSDG